MRPPKRTLATDPSLPASELATPNAAAASSMRPTPLATPRQNDQGPGESGAPGTAALCLLPDRRGGARFATVESHCRCELWGEAGQVHGVDILDVGVSGVRVRLAWDEAQGDPLAAGGRLTFGACSVPHWGELLEGQQGCVRWRRGAEAGVLLNAPLCARSRQRAQRAMLARRPKVYGA